MQQWVGCPAHLTLRQLISHTLTHRQCVQYVAGVRRLPRLSCTCSHVHVHESRNSIQGAIGRLVSYWFFFFFFPWPNECRQLFSPASHWEAGENNCFFSSFPSFLVWLLKCIISDEMSSKDTSIQPKRQLTNSSYRPVVLNSHSLRIIDCRTKKVMAQFICHSPVNKFLNYVFFKIME